MLAELIIIWCMLSYKKIFAAALLLVMLCSCAERKVAFDAKKNINARFFKKIPGIDTGVLFEKPVVTTAPWLNIYEATFRQKFIESDDLIEYTETNDLSEIDTVNYINAKGVYSQTMYIVKYKFVWNVSTVFNGAVFFSVKYHNNNCIGFGPAYFGIINPSKNLINFTTELKVKGNDKNFWLKPLSKYKEGGGYLFMPAAENDTIINIKKIVKLDVNKIGGEKRLVFDIDDILHDRNALLFHYKKTIQLKR